MTRKDDAEILRGEKIKAVMTEFATELIDNEELIASNAEYDAEIAAADACKDKQVENIKGNAEKKKAFRTPTMMRKVFELRSHKNAFIL